VFLRGKKRESSTILIQEGKREGKKSTGWNLAKVTIVTKGKNPDDFTKKLPDRLKLGFSV